MASSKKRPSVSESLTLEALEKRMAMLELENSQLKKKIQTSAKSPSMPSPAISPGLTPKQKEALVVSTVGFLMTKITSKVTERVRREISRANSKAEAESIIQGLSFRVNVIYDEGEETPIHASQIKRRGRSKTRDE